jgi:hypothetical protein
MEAALLTYFDESRIPATGFAEITATLPPEMAERTDAAKAAGLEGLALRETDEVLIPLLRAERLNVVIEQLGMAPLSALDYALWAVFLPTSYFSHSSGAWPAPAVIREGLKEHDGYYYLAQRSNQRSEYDWPGKFPQHWAGYVYEDGMPMNVRLLIARLRPVFDAFEIRTPEQYRPGGDPGLFGWIGRAAFLLARWGKTDSNLFSFEDVRDVILPTCDEARCAHDDAFLFGDAAARRVVKAATANCPHLLEPIKNILCTRLRLVEDYGW